jgi:hypothetical protein
MTKEYIHVPIVTLNDFMKEIQKWIDRGHGDKPILMDGPHQFEYTINSIQMNTCPDEEPDYLSIMAGDKCIINDDQSITIDK